MNDFLLRRFTQLRRNYWFWPSAMTLCATVLGFALPYLDLRFGSDWVQAVGFMRTTQVEGARAILTTLAGATLGVAGVAFSVTIVAVSFATANYGPRLINNFMADTKNQVILGIFVATFVYCITVLSTVHAPSEVTGSDLEAFVPQLSVLFALLLTLACVGALIAYIQHIPESINIMNLTAMIGGKLETAIIGMLDAQDTCDDGAPDAVDVKVLRAVPEAKDADVIRAPAAGFLQQFDLESLTALAQENGTQIILHRSPGDFLVTGETIMSARRASGGDGSIAAKMRDCYTQGTNRTDVQDILFLSDQLVEVLGRAMSPAINDPQTAMLCLDWLRSGLVEFARRRPARPVRNDDPVLYRRVTFEYMLKRCFDRMRQYLASDRTATLHALNVLTSIATSASRPAMADACVRQMHLLARSAKELLAESAAQSDIDAALAKALGHVQRG